jgi:hypothetical protein
MELDAVEAELTTFLLLIQDETGYCRNGTNYFVTSKSRRN